MSSLKAKVIILSVGALIALVALLVWQPTTKAGSRGESLFVYCAAGLQPPVAAAAQKYETEFGVPIRLQYGGSGTLLSNLRVAKTGDLFVAADNSYTDLAREQGLVDETLPLAQLRPVLAVARGNPKGVRSADDLVRSDVRVGLGSPEAASIGRQTRNLLQQSGRWAAVEKAVQERGVFKPTVNEVANDIKIGTIDAGVIWDATVKQYPELEAVAPLCDEASFSLQVVVGVLNSSKQPTEALRFARFLGSRDRGLREFAQHGYAPVEGDAWEARPEILLFSGGVNRVAIEETIRRFEQREGVRVTSVYNGCGILVSQMKAGERPDAYLACDRSFLTPVRELFREATDISETKMVIAVAKGNPRHITSLSDLAAARLKVGVANAQQSTLGALTENLLRECHLLEAVMRNVRSQTPTADMLVNQLRTGALDAVIVYEANVARLAEHVDIARINLPAAKAIQPFAVARNTDHPQLVNRLLEAIQSEESRHRYQESGFLWLVKAKQP